MWFLGRPIANFLSQGVAKLISHVKERGLVWSLLVNLLSNQISSLLAEPVGSYKRAASCDVPAVFSDLLAMQGGSTDWLRDHDWLLLNWKNPWFKLDKTAAAATSTLRPPWLMRLPFLSQLNSRSQLPPLFSQWKETSPSVIGLADNHSDGSFTRWISEDSDLQSHGDSAALHDYFKTSSSSACVLISNQISETLYKN